MNICQKINCNKSAIHRSKFCIEHEIRKRINTEEDIIKEDIIKEERKLKKEQEDEYKLCLEYDRKVFEDKELQKIIEESLDSYYSEKKNLIETKDNDSYYTIKIKFQFDNIVQKFDMKSKISDIFNVIDVYIYEKKININNYNIILNFPKKVFTKENKDIFLYELNLEQNFLLHVQDLEN